MNKFVKILVQLVNNYCCILFCKKLFPSASATLNFETVNVIIICFWCNTTLESWFVNVLILHDNLSMIVVFYPSPHKSSLFLN